MEYTGRNGYENGYTDKNELENGLTGRNGFEKVTPVEMGRKWVHW